MLEHNEALESIALELRGIREEVGGLREQVRSQSERIGLLERGATQTASVSSSGMYPSSVVPPVPVPPRYIPPSPVVNTTGSVPDGEHVDVVAWFKEDWPMKIGALLLILGFGLFVSLSFNMIGPLGRITIGMVVGVLVLLGGFFRLQKSVDQGGVLLGIGTVILAMTIYAGDQVYHIFPDVIAMFIMTLIVVFTAYASVTAKSRAIAFMSLIAGGMVPILVHGSGDILPLFMYLFFLSIGTLWVVRLTAWRSLTFASLALVSVYAFPILSSAFVLRVLMASRLEYLIIAFAFATLYYVVGFFGVLKERKVDAWDIATTALNGLLLLGWIYAAVPTEWQSIVTVSVALLSALGAFLIFQSTGIAEPVYLYAGNMSVFFVMATADELSGSLLVLAVTLEVGLIISGTLMLLRSSRIAEKMLVLMAIPVFASLFSLSGYADSPQGGIFTRDFFAILVAAVVWGLLAYLYQSATPYSVFSQGKEKTVRLSGVCGYFSAFYTLYLVWYGLQHALPNKEKAAMIALIIFALVGITAYLKGLLSDWPGIRKFGTLMIALVVVRLLLVELPRMSTPIAISTLFVIGTLFVGSVLLSRKKSGSPSRSNSNVLSGMIGLLYLCLALTAQAAPADSPRSTPDFSAYEYTETVPVLNIAVPTVVEMPISNPIFREGGFSVYNETSKTFEPVLFRSAVEKTEPTMTVQTNISGPTSNLTDRQSDTFVDFPVKEEGDNSAEIDVTLSEARTVSGIRLSLDDHVALPKTADIRTVQADGSESIVLANSPVSDRSLRFPKTRAKEWRIRLTYVQPLRITELSLFEDNAPVTRQDSLRFLAQPGESYRIYFGADRRIRSGGGESANLADDRDVLRIPEGRVSANVAYVQADTDQDGVPDFRDNCVSVSNADQADVNKNGRGDACDDYDKDGVMNAKDNCINIPNRDQIDSDHDGIGDACDTEESRITERYSWLPWAAMALTAGIVIGLFVVTLRQERNKKI